ncbi:MAG: hypothetical protein KAJ19_21815 [Gammaproteobacteria bacterium]|nr:hypothetical protein [Gammaproteobacteria bacterium]
MIDMIEGMLRYPLTETVNNMVACDQIRFEIDGDLTISANLLEGSNGVICTKQFVFFGFDSELTNLELSSLDSIVAAHTGAGLASANELEGVAVAELPTGLSPGSTFYVTDGDEGPAPAYYNGADWVWYASGNTVGP